MEGDLVKAIITNRTANFMKAELLEVIEAGNNRVAPPCPYFNDCGGCGLQHLRADYYRDFKKRVVENALRKSGFASASPEFVFLPPASRRRVQFRLLKVDEGYSLALMASRSHKKIAIDNCLILEENSQQFMPLLCDAINRQSFVDDISTISVTSVGPNVEIVISLQESSASIDRIEKYADYKEQIKKDLQLLTDIGCVSRVAISNKRQEILFELEKIPFRMEVGGFNIPLSHNTFLQASEAGQKLLTNFVVKHLACIDGKVDNKKSIVDLFCGVGCYSLALVKKLTMITSIDINNDVIVNILRVAEDNKLNIVGKKRNLFTNPLNRKELSVFDGVIINPPRAGAKEQCQQIAISDVNNVVMISCNPASFARDALCLSRAGFKLKEALAVDQFVWSPHIEIAAAFIR
ncbi:MAG: hypothetical protein R3D71_00100 [Rickettsiales bacterium]